MYWYLLITRMLRGFVRGIGWALHIAVFSHLFGIPGAAISIVLLIGTEYYLEKARDGEDAINSLNRQAIGWITALFSMWMAVATTSLWATLWWTGVFMLALWGLDRLCYHAEDKFMCSLPGHAEVIGATVTTG